MRRSALRIIALALAACAPSTVTPPEPPSTVVTERPAFQLPNPSITMEADPPPPFTYWAPEGSIIRNHGNPGLWVAYLNGRNVKTYFGDQCRASTWQHLVGQPVSSVPTPPPGTELRTSCTSCAVNDDLRPNRINVLFDEHTQRITEIACY